MSEANQRTSCKESMKREQEVLVLAEELKEVLMKTLEPQSIGSSNVPGRLEKKRKPLKNECLRFWTEGSKKKKRCGNNSKNISLVGHRDGANECLENQADDTK